MTTTITTAAGSATEALIEFVEHLRTVTSAGFDALADGHHATASALLSAAEAEVRAVADRLAAALGVEVEGFGGIGDLFGSLVYRLTPSMGDLAEVVDAPAIEALAARFGTD
jgi:pantoate kinase